MKFLFPTAYNIKQLLQVYSIKKTPDLVWLLRGKGCASPPPPLFPAAADTKETGEGKVKAIMNTAAESAGMWGAGPSKYN